MRREDADPPPPSSAAVAAAGLGIVGWLLSLPFYGPLAPRLYGPAAPACTAAFAPAHALGLALLGGLGLARLAGRPAAPAPGATASARAVAAIRLAAPAAALLLLAAVSAGAAASALCAAGGLLAAVPVLTWTLALARLPAPEWPFAAAVAGANAWVWLAGLLPEDREGSLAAVAAASLGLAAGARLLPGLHFPPRSRGAVPPLWPLLLFVAVAYPAGGWLYQLLLPALAGPALTRVGYWPYVAALAAAPLARRRPDLLAAMSLSTVGLFLLAVAVPALAGSPAALWVAYGGVLVGLAWADLFLWLSLVRRVAAGAPAQLGWGLGANVLVLWLTGTLVASGRLEHLLRLPGPPAAAVPLAALLLAVAPLLALQLSRSLPQAGEAGEQRARLRGDSLALLTPTERRVLELILEGRTTEEIAQVLNITVHTVKFHTRNLLRKTGFRTRRELRHTLLARDPAGEDRGPAGQFAPSPESGGLQDP